MGQSNSKNYLLSSTSFDQCFINGELCIHRYYLYRRRRDEEENDFKLKMRFFDIQRKRKLSEISECDSETTTSRSSIRTVKKHKLLVRDNSGIVRMFTPSDT